MIDESSAWKNESKEEKLDINICKFNLVLFLRSLMLLSPVLLLFYNENGLNAGDLFFCQGLFYVFAILFDIPVGYFSNTKSRRNLMIFAFALFLGIWLLWLFFKGYYIIILGEILYALIKTIFDNVPSGYAYDYLKTKNKQMEKYWGYSNFYMSFGIAAGSLLGAFLYSKYGSSLILIAESVLMIICILLISSLPNIKPPKPEQKSFNDKLNEYISVTKNICTNKSIIYYILYSGLLNALSYLFALGFQPVMQNALFPVVLFGIIYFVNYFIKSCAGIVVGKWLKNIQIRLLILPLFILYLIAFGFIFIILSCKNIIVDFILMTLICLIIGLQIIFLILHISRLHKFVPMENRGSLMTINNSVARFLPAVFLISSRLFMDKLGVGIFFFIVFIFFVIFGSYVIIRTYEIKD